MKNRLILIVLGLLISIFVGCTKSKDETDEVDVVHQSYHEGEVEKLYDEALTNRFRNAMDVFSKKFSLSFDKLELLKFCGAKSYSKHSPEELEEISLQMEALTEYIKVPQFFGKAVTIFCYRGKSPWGDRYGGNGLEPYEPIPIGKYLSAQISESIGLYTQNYGPAENLLEIYTQDPGSEPFLLESRKRVEQLSGENLKIHLNADLMGFHNLVAEALKQGEETFSPEVINSFLLNHFSGEYKTIAVDWDTSSGPFLKHTYLNAVFGNSKELYKYEISIRDQAFSFEVYRGDIDRDQVISFLLKAKDPEREELSRFDAQYLLADGYVNKKGILRLTKYDRNKTGKIIGKIDSRCDGSLDFFKKSGDKFFTLKDHSTCQQDVVQLNSEFVKTPFDPASSLIEGENLSFDKKVVINSPIVIAQIGSGIDFNHPKLNWRLLTEGQSLVSYNQMDQGELPYEDLLFNNPFDFFSDISYGSALSTIMSYGSSMIRVLPVKIDAYNPDFEKIFDFLQKKNTSLVLLTPSAFEYFDHSNSLLSLKKALDKNPNMFVVIDAGNHEGNLNKQVEHIGCIQHPRSLIVTASLKNEQSVSDSVNFGNKCVDVAAEGSHFLINREFTRKVNGKYSSTDPEEVATGFAAAKLTNYLAKSILLGVSKAETSKQLILEKTVSVPSLKPYIKEGRILPAYEMEKVIGYPK